MKRFLFILKIVFIISLMVWLAIKFDIEQAKQVIAAADLRWALASMIGMLTAWYIYAYRWAVLVRSVWPELKLSLSYYLWYCLIAGFYSLFFPTFISGEVVRVFKLGAHVNKDYIRCTITVAVERVIGVSIWFLAFLVSPSPIAKNIYFWLFLFVAGIAGLYILRNILRKVKKDLLSVYMNNPGSLMKSAAASAIGQIIFIIVNFAAFKCFGIDIPFFHAVGLISLGILSGIVPVSLLGVGLKEGIFIAFLPVYGASSSQILMSIGLMMFLVYFNGIIGGIIELAHAGWKLSSLKNTSYVLDESKS